jgi:hypothetical protein
MDGMAMATNNIISYSTYSWANIHHTPVLKLCQKKASKNIGFLRKYPFIKQKTWKIC